MSTAGVQVVAVTPSSPRDRESVCSNSLFIRSWMETRSRNGSHFTTAITHSFVGSPSSSPHGAACLRGARRGPSLLTLAQVLELRVHDLALGCRSRLGLRLAGIGRRP